MWPYWLLFGVTASMALQQKRPLGFGASPYSRLTFGWVVGFVLLALAIGLRHEVGGDWRSYQWHIDVAVGDTLENILARQKDPVFAWLNWFGANIWGGTYFVNFACGLFFTWGLITFSRTQPRPWLAMLVAVPYLITVVAMGYTRQGAAIGLAMLGLSALMRGSVFRFMWWLTLAVAFHKSAIILVPLAVFSRSHNRFLTLAGVLLVTALLFVLMVQELVDNLVAGYIVAEYESSGAAIRIAMNAMPAAVFLCCRRRFVLSDLEKKFWTWMSIGGLLFVVLLIASSSSTAVDRLALYWIPLQLFVLSRLPDAIGRSRAGTQRWVCMVVAYCFFVHFVWLFFATHASYWIPYRFYPWEWLWQ